MSRRLFAAGQNERAAEHAHLKAEVRRFWTLLVRDGYRWQGAYLKAVRELEAFEEGLEERGPGKRSQPPTGPLAKHSSPALRV